MWHVKRCKSICNDVAAAFVSSFGERKKPSKGNFYIR